MILSLNYSNLSGTVQQTNKLCEELGQYCDELNRKVQKKMYSVEGGMSSHLNNADYYVNNKIKKLREKQENAYNISKRVSELLSTAQRVDEDVARLIENRQKEFFKENSDLKTPLYQSVIQGLIGNTPLGSFLLALNLFKHFSPVEELQKNIKNSFKSAFNSAQNYVGNISDKVSSTVKNITDKEDKKSTGNVLAVAGILASANSVKSWVSDLISSIKDFWQKHWGTTTTTTVTEAKKETYAESIARLRNMPIPIQIQLHRVKKIAENVYEKLSGTGQCHICAYTNLLNRRMAYDGNSGFFTVDDIYKSIGCTVVEGPVKYKGASKATGYLVNGENTQIWNSKRVITGDGSISYQTRCIFNNKNMSSFLSGTKFKTATDLTVAMLTEHPEGIIIRSKYSGNSAHAIVISDYYIGTDGKYHFNIVDSVNQYSGPIENSYYGKSGKWNNWDTFISGITHISYIEPPPFNLND